MDEVFGNTNISEFLDKDIIAQIAYYYNENLEYSIGEKPVANKILDIYGSPNGSQKLRLLNSCIKRYMQKNSVEYWTPIADRIIDNLLQCNIKNIEDIDKIDEDLLDKIIKILIQNPEQNLNMYQKYIFKQNESGEYYLASTYDYDNLKEFVERSEQDFKIYCNNHINSEQIQDKKEAVILSKFGYSMKDAEYLVRVYGNDIEKIKNEELKRHIKELITIINLSTSDTHILDEMYSNNPDVSIDTKDFCAIENNLKSEFGQLFNQDLLRVENCEPTNIENVYEAGTNFNIIIHVVASIGRMEIEDDYMADWNRPSLKIQQFSASYIRNDMIGTVTIPKDKICYGFIDLKPDALVCMRSKGYCHITSRRFCALPK